MTAIHIGISIIKENGLWVYIINPFIVMMKEFQKEACLPFPTDCSAVLRTGRALPRYRSTPDPEASGWDADELYYFFQDLRMPGIRIDFWI